MEFTTAGQPGGKILFFRFCPCRPGAPCPSLPPTSTSASRRGPSGGGAWPTRSPPAVPFWFWILAPGRRRAPAAPAGRSPRPRPPGRRRCPPSPRRPRPPERRRGPRGRRSRPLEDGAHGASASGGFRPAATSVGRSMMSQWLSVCGPGGGRRPPPTTWWTATGCHAVASAVSHLLLQVFFFEEERRRLVVGLLLRGLDLLGGLDTVSDGVVPGGGRGVPPSPADQSATNE